MLFFDKTGLIQKDFEYMDQVCRIWMGHYNFMISISSNDSDKEYYQERFNEFRFYDC